MPTVGVAAFPAAGLGAGDALCAAAAPLGVRTAGTGRRNGGIAQGAHGFAVLQRVLQLAVKDVPDYIGQAAAGHEWGFWEVALQRGMDVIIGRR